LRIIDIAGVLIFIILIIFLPIIMRMRIYASIEGAISELTGMVGDAEELILELSQVKEMELLEGCLEFFIVPPADVDPHGVAEKFRRLLEMGDERLEKMAGKLAPGADPELRARIVMCLKIGTGLRGILKFLNHSLETARKTGNLQMLLALQMNLALIMRTARAYMDGLRAISSCLPIGDGAGPLTAGMLIDEGDEREYIHDMVHVRKSYHGKDLSILRPRGPGPRLGKIVRALEEILDEREFDRIIMVDAAAKLEGEETGTVAEGVGVAIGGSGVEKWFIENMILSSDVTAVIIKMGPEEALGQMTGRILEACSAALETIKRIMDESDAGSVLLIGVGNSSGIPDAVEDPLKLKIKKDKERN